MANDLIAAIGFNTVIALVGLDHQFCAMGYTNYVVSRASADTSSYSATTNRDDIIARAPIIDLIF